MVMVSQRFPGLFAVLPYILAVKERPLRKQTMDIFHEPFRVNVAVSQTISDISCVMCFIYLTVLKVLPSFNSTNKEE